MDLNNRGRAAALPLSLIAQAVPMLTRHELANLTERLIERLDAVDGDPDLGEDDPGGLCDEDGVNTAYAFITRTMAAQVPGCPISDDDCGRC